MRCWKTFYIIISKIRYLIAQYLEVVSFKGVICVAASVVVASWYLNILKCLLSSSVAVLLLFVAYLLMPVLALRIKIA